MNIINNQEKPLSKYIGVGVDNHFGQLYLTHPEAKEPIAISYRIVDLLRISGYPILTKKQAWER